MVTDKVWAEIGATQGFLCIGCLELRLGRDLAATDFAAALVNLPHKWDTPRLADRKSQWADYIRRH